MDKDDKDPLAWPFDVKGLLRSKRKLRQDFLEREGLIEKRVATISVAMHDSPGNSLIFHSVAAGVVPQRISCSSYSAGFGGVI